MVFNERIADVAERFLKKGRKVYVEGSLQTRKWTDQSGQEKFTTEVVIDRFRGDLTLIDSNRGGDEAGGDSYGGGSSYGGGNGGGGGGGSRAVSPPRSGARAPRRCAIRRAGRPVRRLGAACQRSGRRNPVLAETSREGRCGFVICGRVLETKAMQRPCRGVPPGPRRSVDRCPSEPGTTPE